MIKETLDETNINYRIIPIPDIHNPPMWVSHVVSIVKDFDVVISNNSFTTKLFTEKGYTVEETPYFEGYSGKDIRERITKGETWEDRVPQEVAKVIKNIDGVERIKKLSY
jgi:nicotinamide-nucleotide adenylyltransferase